MLNRELLRKKIQESGITITYIALKMGITRETFYNKMSSGNFKASQIVALTKILSLSKKERDEIFFT